MQRTHGNRALQRLVQGTAQLAPVPAGPEFVGSEAMWRQVVGEQSVSVGKLGRVRAPRGVRLRPRPGAASDLILPFDTLVRVERRTEYDWCWVVSMGGGSNGKTGFCEEQFLSIDPPEPTAHLYQVQKGDTLGGIAERYYGKSFRKGNDARLYVQALYEANRSHKGVYLEKVSLSWRKTWHRREAEEQTLEVYKGAKVRRGMAIWVPSEAFIQQLKAAGAITTGSSELSKAWRKARKYVDKAIEAVKYIAGFIVGLLEGAWDAIVDVFKGAVDMIETVAKVLYHLITGNPGAVKDMLMGWVDKLKQAWASRSQIADDFMRKWEAEDGWDRGRFQGKVLGWVMMTALIVILTAGAGAIPQIAGKWKFVIDALKLADRVGDVGTYVRAAGKLPGKATDFVRRTLGGKAERVAERVEETAEKAGKKAAGKVATEVPVQLGKESHSLKVVKVGGRHQIWICSDHCGDIIARIDKVSDKVPQALRNELEALKREARDLEKRINKGEIPVDSIPVEEKKIGDKLSDISNKNPEVAALLTWQYLPMAGSYRLAGRTGNVLRLTPEDWTHILEGHVKATFNPAKRAGKPVSTVFKGTAAQYLEILQEAVRNQAVLRELNKGNGVIHLIVRNQRMKLEVDIATGAIKTFHAEGTITNKALYDIIRSS